MAHRSGAVAPQSSLRRWESLAVSAAAAAGVAPNLHPTPSAEGHKHASGRQRLRSGASQRWLRRALLLLRLRVCVQADGYRGASLARAGAPAAPGQRSLAHVPPCNSNWRAHPLQCFCNAVSGGGGGGRDALRIGVAASSVRSSSEVVVVLGSACASTHEQLADESQGQATARRVRLGGR